MIRFGVHILDRRAATVDTASAANRYAASTPTEPMHRPEVGAVEQPAQAVDGMAHRHDVVHGLQRRGQGLPRERAAGADELDDHEDESEELADRAEPRRERVQDRDERHRGEAQEEEREHRMGDPDVDAAPDDEHERRHLDETDERRGEPPAEGGADRALARRERPRSTAAGREEEHVGADPAAPG